MSGGDLKILVMVIWNMTTQERLQYLENIVEQLAGSLCKLQADVLFTKIKAESPCGCSIFAEFDAAAEHALVSAGAYLLHDTANKAHLVFTDTAGRQQVFEYEPEQISKLVAAYPKHVPCHSRPVFEVVPLRF